MESTYTAYFLYEVPISSFQERPVHLSLYECSVSDIAKIANKVHRCNLEDNVWEDYTKHFLPFVPNYLLPKDNMWVGNDPNGGSPFEHFGLIEEVSDVNDDFDMFFTPLDREDVDGLRFNLVCRKGSPADVLAKIMVGMNIRRYDIPNMLEDHPDGLGKHIKMHRMKGHILRDVEYLIEESITAEEIPFMVTWGDEQYVIFLGTDLTNGTKPAPSIDYMQERINGDLKFYVDQIWDYLKWNKNSIMVHLIGFTEKK